MRLFLLVILIIFGVFMVLYLSWIGSPRFSLNTLVPDWIAKWADKHDNDNIRTAVPLVFLGAVTGLFLMFRNLKAKWWLLGFWGLVMLVFVAELGQLLLPLRSFDWMDITWGSLGAGTGVITIYSINFLLKKRKNF